MVDEGNTVQTPFGVDAVDHLDVQSLQPCGKILFRTYVLHGFRDFLTCTVGQSVLLHTLGGTGEAVLQGIITEWLSELAGLERRADLFPLIVQQN